MPNFIASVRLALGLGLRPVKSGRPVVSPACAGRLQRGFALVELTIALLIAAVLGIYATARVVQTVDDATAQSTGVYVNSAGVWAERYVLQNYDALATGGPVPGVVNPLQPTFTELKALGRLPSTFPQFSPSQQQLRFDVARTACPGAGCVITATACLTTPLLIRGLAREDLATVAVIAMQGNGGRSQIGNGAVVRGAGFTMPNPVPGNPVGIICGQTVVDSALYNQFVKVRDTRDPDLQGGMTLSGALPNTFTLDVNGTANFAGGITTGGAITLDANGAAGAACAPDNQMVWGVVNGSPTLLKCSGGVWTPTGVVIGTAGVACALEGLMAQTLTGSGLVCRDARFRPVVDLFGRQGVMSTALYAQGQTVPSPSCDPSMVPRVIPMGVVTACVIGGGTCANNTGSFQGLLLPGNVVSIQGSDGSVAGASAQMAVATVCSTS